MSTINKSLALELVRGNGKSKSGSAGYCLVRYQNRTKYDIKGVDHYNPDAENNVFDYAIFPNRVKYETFLESETVGGVDILWGSEKFSDDEKERELEEEEELLREAADLFFPEESEIKPRGSRKER